jgi:predicted flap endonuclease-1-like 5' DNA nuclease
VNGLTLLALIALAIGVLVAYRLGALHGRREHLRSPQPATGTAGAPAAEVAAQLPPVIGAVAPAPDPMVDERARLVRSSEAELWSIRQTLATRDAEAGQLRDFAADRRRLFAMLADARAETARYRQVVVDLENDAPPPLLDGPGSPDDLKLIVGIGPVLERMLQQMGVGTYRQIARWSEHDVDEFDAKLAEFPGRIRRDAWVTQARELHHSKYGEWP